MEELMAEILAELEIELELDANSEEDARDISILEVKLKNAMREIKNAFNFKSYHEEDFILAEMTKVIGNIKALAIYDFMKIGAEGEKVHTEKNVSRTYSDRKDCFNGIVRFAD